MTNTEAEHQYKRQRQICQMYLYLCYNFHRAYYSPQPFTAAAISCGLDSDSRIGDCGLCAGAVFVVRERRLRDPIVPESYALVCTVPDISGRYYLLPAPQYFSIMEVRRFPVRHKRAAVSC